MLACLQRAPLTSFVSRCSRGIKYCLRGDGCDVVGSCSEWSACNKLICLSACLRACHVTSSGWNSRATYCRAKI